jgi:hypothetical protein
MKHGFLLYLRLFAGEIARLFEVRALGTSILNNQTADCEVFRGTTLIHGTFPERKKVWGALEELIRSTAVFGNWLDTSVSLIMIGKMGGGFGAYYPSGFTVYLTADELRSTKERLMCLLARRIAFNRVMRGRGFTCPTKLGEAYLIALKAERGCVPIIEVDSEYLQLLDARIIRWAAFSYKQKKETTPRIQ